MFYQVFENRLICVYSLPMILHTLQEYAQTTDADQETKYFDFWKNEMKWNVETSHLI